MLLDHLGYWDNIAPLRAIGRLAMPMYCMLFVISVQKNQVKGMRLLVLAALSQIPFMFFFEKIDTLELNIILGFYIFHRLIEGIRKRDPIITTGAIVVIWMTSGMPGTIIPVSYGWYLYATLFIFYWGKSKTDQRFLFALITCAYIYMTQIPRQLIAITVPFITKIKLPRPNKYLYRYFYPGHLAILVIAKTIVAGSLLGGFYGFWGVNTPPEEYFDDDYYDESGYYYEDYEMILLEKAVEDVNSVNTSKED